MGAYRRAGPSAYAGVVWPLRPYGWRERSCAPFCGSQTKTSDAFATSRHSSECAASALRHACTPHHASCTTAVVTCEARAMSRTASAAMVTAAVALTPRARRPPRASTPGPFGSPQDAQPARRQPLQQQAPARRCCCRCHSSSVDPATAAAAPRAAGAAGAQAAGPARAARRAGCTAACRTGAACASGTYLRAALRTGSTESVDTQTGGDGRGTCWRICDAGLTGKGSRRRVWAMGEAPVRFRNPRAHAPPVPVGPKTLTC
jgi:hypothetical protein